jgi:hypothetical protein
MTDTHAGTGAAASTSSTRSALRVGSYSLIVLAAILAAAYYRLRADTIFGCQAAGYAGDHYLSYCQTDGYGDFDHGAFWFDLEPEATQSAAKADLLFIGNSRMQYAFSTDAAREWLTQNGSRYFLLGFAYHPRVLFQRALLRKIHPQARVYVINLDTFFQENASVPAQTVMNDPNAQSHYRGKRFWQWLHRSVCGRMEALCGHSYSIYKDRRTGMWESFGRISANEATSDDPNIDPEEVAGETSSGRKFIAALGVNPDCVIFTLVPTVDTPYASSSAIAKALAVELIAPRPDDLLTFDGSHLDHKSAERWSAAFFAAAGPKIRACLNSAKPTLTTAARR